MKSLIGRLLCFLTRRHLRGKLLDEIDGVRTFRCPRCSATWTRRKAKVK